MSIRPVDLQVIIPRATEVGRVQHATDQQLASQQQQFAEQWQQISERRRQSVQRLPKSQGGKINRDDQKKKEQSQGNKQSDRHPEQTFADEGYYSSKDSARANKYIDPALGHVVDIKT